MRFLKVTDDHVQFLRWRWTTGRVSCVLAFAQLIITCAALGQHIYSYVNYNIVLKCEFNSTISPYLSSDIIVYDFGLFHRLWNIDQCIANHLDGGWMRFVWCITQLITTLTFILVSLCVKNQKPYHLWPALTQESIYAIGLLILTISSLPKFLPSIFEKLGQESCLPMLIYMIGASMNFFLTYVLWHYFWYLEEVQKRASTVSFV